MNLAKVSDNGQITVPVEIRRALNIRAGDKMIFFRNSNGEMIVQNTNSTAISEAQAAVAGSIYSEDDVLADVMEFRYGVANVGSEYEAKQQYRFVDDAEADKIADSILQKHIKAFEELAK